MQKHGPDGLHGPLRGTRSWWHGPAHQNSLAEDTAPSERIPRNATDSQKNIKTPGMRTELIERIRKEIAAGTYDTPERWEMALDHLLSDLEKD